MERTEDKVQPYPKIPIVMMVKIFREERYRYHYESIMSGDYMKWYRLYCYKMFEVLNGNNKL
jgi:hypothetical protein